MDRNFYGLTRNSTAAYSRVTQDMDSNLEELNPLPEFSVAVPPNPRLVAMMEKEGVGAEKFRMLAARLQYLRKQRQLKKLVITSTLKGEGKSVISANLALTLARRQRTLLIDGDLRQSGLKDLFGNHDLVLATRRSHGRTAGDLTVSANVGDADSGRGMVRVGHY